MKNRMLLMGVVFLTLLCSFAPSDWFLFDSRPGGFRSKFPRDPVQTVQPADDFLGAPETTTYTYDVGKFKDDNICYSISYADYPDTLIHSDFKDEITEKFLKNAIGNAVKKGKARELSTFRINFKDYPARKLKMSYAEAQKIAYIEYILVRNRLYTLQVNCEVEHDNNNSIDKFFKSFSLLSEGN